MDAQEIANKLLSIAETASVGDALKAKLEQTLKEKKGFTVVQAFEPNGRINIAQAMQIAISARVVGECGGNFIVFIADVVASMNHAFGRDKSQIDAASRYAIQVLKASGVDGPHVKYVTGDEFTLDNFVLFAKFAEITTHIPAAVVQKALPPMPKKERETLTASQVIAPMMHLTELTELGADIIIASSERVPLLSLISYVKPENPPVIIPLRQVMKMKGVKSNPPKPDPRNTVFFDDSNEILLQKFNGAFCTDEIVDNPVFEFITNLAMLKDGSFTFNSKKYEKGTDDFAKDFPTLEKKPLKETLAQIFISFAEPAKAALANPEFAPTAKTVFEMTTAH